MILVDNVHWKIYKDGPLKYLAYRRKGDRGWIVTERLFVNFANKLEDQVRAFLTEKDSPKLD